jgi:thiosulfate/3-mercaptopyruvate sulfurtransferase
MNARSAGTSIPSPLVSSQWVHEHLGNEDLRILDCTVVMKIVPGGGYGFAAGRAEWEAGHLPGAQFVDVMADLSAQGSPLPMMMPAPQDFARTMSELGVGEGTRAVLYDRGNHAWAARVWWMLHACGFDQAAVLDGGWLKWTAEGRPATTQVSRYARAAFEARVRPDAFATREQVLQALEDDSVCVLNALSPEEHRGTTVRFPRAGRIAGSTNVYCQLLVDPETHAYRPAHELRRLFEAAGATRADRVITYCGAGIAASSDALALTLLGKRVSVYDGSLAEWTSDPSLPMEAGASS